MAQLIVGDEKDLDGFQVQRILPNKAKKMVGPFIFLDHLGPAHFKAGSGINVRPHPHIGLATLSYLFSGSMLHRDSLGSIQEIRPGEVNWMTAGRGIVHSERETLEVRANPHQVNGLQFWLALPVAKAEIEPSFQHVKSNELPHFYLNKTVMRLIAGEAYGMTSPVRTHSPLFLLDILSDQNEQIALPNASAESAVYVQQGRIQVGDQSYASGSFVLLESQESITVLEPSRFILLGGEAFQEKPYIRWNFVAYSRERIAQAEDDWRNQRFPKIHGDDQEFTPLP